MALYSPKTGGGASAAQYRERQRPSLLLPPHLFQRSVVVNAMQQALQAATDGVNNGFLTQQEGGQIRDSIKAYGTPGVDNGVTVGISNETNVGGHTSVEGSQVIVAFNLSGIGAADVAHEGVHARHALNYVATGINPTLFSTERDAYTVGGLTSVGLTKLNANGQFSIVGYVPQADNGVSTRIWGPPGPGENSNLAVVKSNIGSRVITHLSNNGINPNTGDGIKPAFPGVKRSWR